MRFCLVLSASWKENVLYSLLHQCIFMGYKIGITLIMYGEGNICSPEQDTSL